MPAADHVVRAMTNDGAFRIVAARTTDTVAGVVRAQEARGEDARILGELVTGAILYRETMAPTLRVQGLLRGAGDTGQLVGDSHPDGWARGLLKKGRSTRTVDLAGEGALLQLTRSLPTGQNHTGTVAIPEDGKLASAFMAYFDRSEQITTLVSVATVLDDSGDAPRVVAAGGFLVQILPEAKDLAGPLAVMTLRLEDFLDLGPRLVDTDASPDHLVEEVFYGMEHTRLGDSPLRFGCNCSRERVMAGFATLRRADIEELVEDGEPLETRCDYCGSLYIIEPELLRGLLASS
ncbi:MAG: Hsp33 family molecular chaperone HslO [Polyangiales bacterium]